MALVTAADHMTGGHILTRQTARSCRDEHHHAWTFRTPRFQRQPWLRAVQGLHLTFLVNAQHGGLLERTDVKPDHIPHLLHEERIGDNLKVSVRWGCRAKARQIRETAVWLKPDVLAMPRVLQCVA